VLRVPSVTLLTPKPSALVACLRPIDLAHPPTCRGYSSEVQQPARPQRAIPARTRPAGQPASPANLRDRRARSSHRGAHRARCAPVPRGRDGEPRGTMGPAALCPRSESRQVGRGPHTPSSPKLVLQRSGARVAALGSAGEHVARTRAIACPDRIAFVRDINIKSAVAAL
jgi:hypothetical protein